MATIKTIELIIPSDYLTTFFYGDDSGLEESDIIAIDKLTDYYLKKHNCFHAVDAVEIGFCHRNDIHGYQGADCHNVIFQIE